MDDILASIRRILNEDEPSARQTPEEPPEETPREETPREVPPKETHHDDVLVLDSSMMVPPDPASPPNQPAAPGAAVAPLPPGPTPPSPSPMPPPGGTLIAPAAAAAAASSVSELMRTLANERNTAIQRGGPTIEDLVRDEMRPLLKEWLDIHLPPLVERLVRAEIERVVGRMAG